MAPRPVSRRIYFWAPTAALPGAWWDGGLTGPGSRPTFYGVRRSELEVRRLGGRARQAALREENAPRDASILSRRASGESVAQLAAAFGMCRQAIYDILKRHKNAGRRRRAAA
jgi:hypothetical protein